ncbi:MAG: CPBP family intramembrane metalloprotease [Clostridia bacterium]|nr:CPBP family intramembrane metalloprotease [Clostridia bacterium]
MENLLQNRQRQFRASGLVVFTTASGLLLCRICASILSLFVENELLIDTIFSCLMQPVIGLLVPFLIYKFYLKKSVLEVFTFSNFRKPDWKVMLLCIPLTATLMVATMVIATIWRLFLISFGYQLPSGGGYGGGEFVLGLMLYEILLSAVFPAVCEEFTDRGGLLTTLRGSFPDFQAALLCGLIFGLSHQNVEQVVYTFFMGVFLAFLTMKTRSIFPAMLVHFINNAVSIYQGYAVDYSLPFHQLINGVYDLIVTNLGLVVAIAWLIIGCGVLLFWLIIRICRKNDEKALEKLKSENPDEEVTLPLDDKIGYKPVFKDWIFIICGMAMMAITTLCTFIWRI